MKNQWSVDFWRFHPIFWLTQERSCVNGYVYHSRTDHYRQFSHFSLALKHYMSALWSIICRPTFNLWSQDLEFHHLCYWSVVVQSLAFWGAPIFLFKILHRVYLACFDRYWTSEWHLGLPLNKYILRQSKLDFWRKMTSRYMHLLSLAILLRTLIISLF